MELSIMKNSRVLISKMTIGFLNSILKIPKYDVLCKNSKVFYFYMKTCMNLVLLNYESLNAIVTAVLCVSLDLS